jgi:hypothetical protein
LVPKQKLYSDKPRPISANYNLMNSIGVRNNLINNNNNNVKNNSNINNNNKNNNN